MSILYETIATLCKKKQLSIAALCRKANVSAGIISDLKTGRKKTISVETATKLAAALEVSADVLTGAHAQGDDPLLTLYEQVKDLLDARDKQELIAFMQMKVAAKQFAQHVPE